MNGLSKFVRCVHYTSLHTITTFNLIYQHCIMQLFHDEQVAGRQNPFIMKNKYAGRYLQSSEVHVSSFWIWRVPDGCIKLKNVTRVCSELSAQLNIFLVNFRYISFFWTCCMAGNPMSEELESNSKKNYFLFVLYRVLGNVSRLPSEPRAARTT